MLTACRRLEPGVRRLGVGHCSACSLAMGPGTLGKILPLTECCPLSLWNGSNAACSTFLIDTHGSGLSRQALSKCESDRGKGFSSQLEWNSLKIKDTNQGSVEHTWLPLSILPTCDCKPIFPADVVATQHL